MVKFTGWECQFRLDKYKAIYEGVLGQMRQTYLRLSTEGQTGLESH